MFIVHCIIFDGFFQSLMRMVDKKSSIGVPRKVIIISTFFSALQNKEIFIFSCWQKIEILVLVRWFQDTYSINIGRQENI